jgi:hypothetical protein
MPVILNRESRILACYQSIDLKYQKNGIFPARESDAVTRREYDRYAYPHAVGY